MISVSRSRTDCTDIKRNLLKRKHPRGLCFKRFFKMTNNQQNTQASTARALATAEGVLVKMTPVPEMLDDFVDRLLALLRDGLEELGTKMLDVKSHNDKLGLPLLVSSLTALTRRDFVRKALDKAENQQLQLGVNVHMPAVLENLAKVSMAAVADETETAAHGYLALRKFSQSFSGAPLAAFGVAMLEKGGRCFLVASGWLFL